MVKAPTLVLDDGTVLMDSSLILDYLECLAGRERSLLPQRPQARAQALSLIGAALVACEKSVQIYYELNLRPEERRHGPWLERVEGQLLAAYDWLEAALRQEPLARDGGIELVRVTVAVAWRFSQLVVAERVAASEYPELASYSDYAEGLPVFLETPPVSSPRGARLAPLETARLRLRPASVRCRSLPSSRPGPVVANCCSAPAWRRPGLAQPGPERGPRLALRHAAGRALVRLLDP